MFKMVIRKYVFISASLLIYIVKSKRMKRNQILGILLILSVIMFSCGKELEDGNQIMSGKYNDKESHNAGQDCGSCH
jgi:hypothetical protein